MKHRYNKEYFPAIPVLKIRISTPEWGLYTGELNAIIDTGSDGTLIPLKYLREIDASVEGQSRLSSQWGEARAVNLYMVDIEIEQRTLPGIWVVGDDLSEEIILGRNVLNRLRLLLDGFTESSQVLYL